MRFKSVGQRWGIVVVLASLAGVADAAEAPMAQPSLPYYSLELSSANGPKGAAIAMRRFKDVPYLRAEKRAHGYKVRAGAWASPEEAAAAAEHLRARGSRPPRVLHMETAAAWLLPGGETLAPPASAMIAVSAPTAPAPAPAEAAAAPLAAAIGSPEPAPAAARSVPAVSDDFRGAARDLATDLVRFIGSSGLARKDGFTYGLDVTPLLLYAARGGDRALYEQVLSAARKLIIDDPHEPFSQGFVLWRAKDGVKAEISGAPEMLGMARALFAGAAAFDRPDDGRLAARILGGYAKHAFELQGIWMVRRYFSFADGTFSGISLLPDYAPDFLADVERQQPGTPIAGFAEREYGVIGRVAAPSGLLYPVIHPEIGATYPGLGVEVYAPNGIASLEDSCAAAEGALRGAPKVAQKLLDFISVRKHRDDLDALYAYYHADSGAPAGVTPLSTTGYACLGRLAAVLDDGRATKILDPLLVQNLRMMAEIPQGQSAPLFMSGPLLLMAQTFGALPQGGTH